MFESIRSLFTTDATKEEFKQFLQQYHQRLERKHNLGHVGLTKCLHAVAEELGFKNFQTLDALTDAQTKVQPAISSEFFTLWFVEKSVHSLDCGNRYVFPSAEAAVAYLWDYVQGRIINCCMDEFMEEYEDTMDAYGFSEDDTDDGLGLQDQCSLFMLSLSWEDAIDVIEWYFAFMDDDMFKADYELVCHAGPEDRLGENARLDNAYETEFDHPLLGYAGIEIAKGPVFQDEQLYAITDGPELTRDLHFKSVAKAMGVATRDLVAKVCQLNGTTVDTFLGMSAEEQQRTAVQTMSPN